MKKKLLKEFILLVLWNLFIVLISKRHIMPNFVIWIGGFGTGGFIGLFYISRLKKVA